MKNVLALIGGVALLLALAVWQFGFFSGKTDEIRKHVEEAKIAAKAEKMIAERAQLVRSFESKAHDYSVKSRTLAKSLERDQAEIENVNSAISTLASTAKEAGLPKPSERSQISQELADRQFVFNGKTITGRQVYTTLDRWNARLEQLEVRASQKQKTIAGYANAAESMSRKRDELDSDLVKLQARLDELKTAKDLAAANAEIAEIEANIQGVNVGDAGEILGKLQDQIDELEATAEVFEDEAATRGSAALEPGDVLAPAGKTGEDSLDRLWE